jgi:hypothetical protein
MKNVLLKFAGLFVERVPVDERGNPLPAQPPGPRNAPAGAPQQATPAIPQQHPGQAMPQQQQPMPHVQPAAGMPQQAQPLQGMPMQQPMVGGMPAAAPMPGAPSQPIAVALRAWVPQEYAAHLAPHGVHVIAAGGSVTSEQARGWGADVLIVSAECLGQDTHLLQQPQLATVLITPQPVMLPEVPGVMQVQEPLRASDVAHAAREAAAAFAAARH